MRKYLGKLDWNNMLMNKTAIECWNILKYEIESIIDTFIPLKNRENGLERNTCQKKLLEKWCLTIRPQDFIKTCHHVPRISGKF